MYIYADGLARLCTANFVICYTQYILNVYGYGIRKAFKTLYERKEFILDFYIIYEKLKILNIPASTRYSHHILNISFPYS